MYEMRKIPVLNKTGIFITLNKKSACDKKNGVLLSKIINGNAKKETPIKGNDRK